MKKNTLKLPETLGRPLNFPSNAALHPSSNFTVHVAGKGYLLQVGIGKKHHATLILDEQAHLALQEGQPLEFR